jgi:hypothetical protein
MIGAVAATIVMFYNNRFLGRLVRALLSIDATSPESAIAIEKLGLKLTPAIKNALRPETSFAQTVLRTEDGRFYIAPDKVLLAKKKYRSQDMTIIFVLMSIGIIIAVAFALTYVFPEVIEGAGERLGNLFGEGKGTVI